MGVEPDYLYGRTSHSFLSVHQLANRRRRIGLQNPQQRLQSSLHSEPSQHLQSTTRQNAPPPIGFRQNLELGSTNMLDNTLWNENLVPPQRTPYMIDTTFPPLRQHNSIEQVSSRDPAAGQMRCHEHGAHQILPLENSFPYQPMPTLGRIFEGYIPDHRNTEVEDTQPHVAFPTSAFNGRRNAPASSETIVRDFAEVPEQHSTQNARGVTAPAYQSHTALGAESRPAIQPPNPQASVGVGSLVPDSTTGLYFSSYAHAKAACRRAKWHTPTSRKPLPSTDAEKQEIVVRLRQAILNTTDTKDKKGSAYRKRWEDGTSYLVPHVEHVAWSILEEALNLHQHGFTAPMFDGSQDEAFDKDLKFGKRIDALENLFKNWKSSCDAVMKGEKIAVYVAAPRHYYHRNGANQKSNARRATTIAIGKAAEANRAPRPPQRRRQVDRDSKDSGDATADSSSAQGDRGVANKNSVRRNNKRAKTVEGFQASANSQDTETNNLVPDFLDPFNPFAFV
ncbi:hypothetical protein AOQ84DRAFT_220543 [Glonium stellatum]|uniref:Uncharacterized protein n=1 Tax=Glonium stellatum TaxID=574774 RepID=A0A8E2F325_9PEZI|nr:hypothetical protein AOQ84DRAFT_220543 [Glonium stellatum]